MRSANDTTSIKIVKLFLILFLTCSTIGFAQTLTSSNLPIVIITTDLDPISGEHIEIPDEPKVGAIMTIIKRPDGSRNYLSDIDTQSYINYTGRIGIEMRGSSSQYLDKKPYGFTTLKADSTTNDNVSLLDMPSENDWILNALNFDPSLMRDFISYNLARRMGNYATHTAYCEVMVNGNYKGLYLLEEKIKVDEDRVNVAKISKSDIELPKLSGGYIVKADKTTGGDVVAWTMASYAWPAEFLFDTPKAKDITPQQQAYIKAEFSKLESKAHTHDSNLTNGYPTVIDIPSFIDFMLINELAANPDAYQFSTYFHKDREGKLRAGPIWDLNLTYGNDLFLWGLDRSKPIGWQFADGGNDGPKFFYDLFMDPTYKCYFSKRWHELIDSNQPMSYYVLESFIDSTAGQIREAAKREEQRWSSVGDLTKSLTDMKAFIRTRTTWISNNIGSSNNCSNIEMPSLVISKINYNPTVSVTYPDSNDQEFIEIQNTSPNTVDLSGFYLRELGVSYQFPFGSTIEGGKTIYLAGNTILFEKQHVGMKAFGQFARNLPNSSFKLILSDAFGNTIDQVNYSDEIPWPNLADGNGYYLKLKSTNLDNNVASNWEASNEELVEPTKPIFRTEITVGPNPATATLNIGSPQTIKQIQFYDLSGKLIMQKEINAKEVTLNVDNLPRGFYLLRITDKSVTQTHKIILK